MYPFFSPPPNSELNLRLAHTDVREILPLRHRLLGRRRRVRRAGRLRLDERRRPLGRVHVRARPRRPAVPERPRGLCQRGGLGRRGLGHGERVCCERDEHVWRREESWRAGGRVWTGGERVGGGIECRWDAFLIYRNFRILMHFSDLGGRMRSRKKSLTLHLEL
jgi:hypothetical protein